MLLLSYQEHVRHLILRSTKKFHCPPYKILRLIATESTADQFQKPGHLQFNIPQRLRQKVVCLEDAVSLVSNGDTVCCSGFVAQGTMRVLIYIYIA